MNEYYEIAIVGVLALSLITAIYSAGRKTPAKYLGDITIHFRTDDIPNCDRCMDGYVLRAMESCPECERVG